jgi:hypothetical protein
MEPAMTILSLLRVTVVVLFCATVVCAVPAAEAQEDGALMWEMRDKYTFDGATVKLAYAVDYGEWRVVAPSLGEVFKPIGSEVVLGDGSVVTPRDCGMAASTRDRAANRVGSGLVFLTMCPVKDDLKITHKLASYQDRSGVTVHLEVENTGTAPVSIQALKPMVVKPGDIRQVQMAVDGEGGPFVFTNAGEGVAILIGSLAIGGAPTQVAFSEGSMAGGATALFDPPLTLAPGERVETDPVMILFVYADPQEAREYFAFTQSDLGVPAPSTAAPEAAAAVEEGASPRERGRARRR